MSRWHVVSVSHQGSADAKKKLRGREDVNLESAHLDKSQRSAEITMIHFAQDLDKVVAKSRLLGDNSSAMRTTHHPHLTTTTPSTTDPAPTFIPFQLSFEYSALSFFAWRLV